MKVDVLEYGVFVDMDDIVETTDAVWRLLGRWLNGVIF